MTPSNEGDDSIESRLEGSVKNNTPSKNSLIVCQTLVVCRHNRHFSIIDAVLPWHYMAWADSTYWDCPPYPTPYLLPVCLLVLVGSRLSPILTYFVVPITSEVDFRAFSFAWFIHIYSYTVLCLSYIIRKYCHARQYL